MKIDITQGELIFGETSGREIIDAIKSATKSVKIISQKVSPIYAQILKELSDQNLQVRLITSENVDKSCYSFLMRENYHIDHKGIAAKKRDEKIAIISLILGIVLLFNSPIFTL